MNRRKKETQKFKARRKKTNAKLAPPTKSTYVNKAERAKLMDESLTST